jgi:hypothetical protein
MGGRLTGPGLGSWTLRGPDRPGRGAAMCRVGGKGASGRPRSRKAARPRQGRCRGRGSRTSPRRYGRSVSCGGVRHRGASRSRRRRAGDQSLRSRGQGRCRGGRRGWCWLCARARFPSQRTRGSISRSAVADGPWGVRWSVAHVPNRGGWRRFSGGRRRTRPMRRTRTRRIVAAPRLVHQLTDSIDHGRVQTGQWVGLHVQTPLLNALEQLLTRQAQFFGQLVNARRQRQLLPASTPVSQAGRDLGVFSMVRIDHLD